MRTAILIVLVLAFGLGGYFYLDRFRKGAGDNTVTAHGSPIAKISVPETLSARAQPGQQTYQANCAACHGRKAARQEGIAPPLVHVIYVPGHYGDESFQRAIALGVRAGPARGPVVEKGCIGCGVCEYFCPAQPSAIQVYPC